MLLFASVFYILQKKYQDAFQQSRKLAGIGILILNISLVIFWASMLGSGLVKIAGKFDNKFFYAIMQDLQPYFKAFTISGVFIFLGLFLIIFSAIKISLAKQRIAEYPHETSLTSEVVLARDSWQKHTFWQKVYYLPVLRVGQQMRNKALAKDLSLTYLTPRIELSHSCWSYREIDLRWNKNQR